MQHEGTGAAMHCERSLTPQRQQQRARRIADLVGWLLVACASLFAPVCAARGNAAYEAIELPPLDQGSTRVVRAVNDFGEAVGGSEVGEQPMAFIVNRTRQFQVLVGLPRSDYTVAFALNNTGVVVGSSNGPSGVHAFRLNRGLGIVDLGTLPGDASSEAFAVNNGGRATGYSSGRSGIRAVVWSSNYSIQALPVLAGSASSRGLGISEAGDVVGVAVVGGMSHAVLWHGSAAQDLGALPGDKTAEALAINNQGQIVGSSGDISVARHAVLWSAKGVIQDLGTLPGGDSSRALGISDNGVVVGTSESSNGTRAFVWTSSEGMQDLNDILTARGGFVLTHATSIAPQGIILAIGHDAVADVVHDGDGHEHELHELPMRIFLLVPQP
jgi:probable HAF family extracellular repeat protein